MTAPATAQSLSSSDIAQAFGGNALTAARSMNAVEMDETEGRWAKVTVEVAKAGAKIAKEALEPKGHTKMQGRQQQRNTRRVTRGALKTTVTKKAISEGLIDFYAT